MKNVDTPRLDFIIVLNNEILLYSKSIPEVYFKYEQVIPKASEYKTCKLNPASILDLIKKNKSILSDQKKLIFNTSGVAELETIEGIEEKINCEIEIKENNLENMNIPIKTNYIELLEKKEYQVMIKDSKNQMMFYTMNERIVLMPMRA